MDIPLRVPDQLGQQLKALRKLRGLSQAELGRRLGVGQTRIADIEANPALVGIEQMMRIFSVLGAEFVLRAAAPVENDAAVAHPPRKNSRDSRAAKPAKPAEAAWPVPPAPPRRVAETAGQYAAKTPAPKPSAPSVLGRAARKGSW